MSWIPKRLKLALSPLFAAVFAGPARAVPEDYKVNVREGCRQSISGAYISAYTERERGRTLVKTLARQIQDTAQALKTSQDELARLKARSAGKDFELQQAVDMDQLTSRIRTLDAQRGDYAGMAQKAHVELAAAEALEKTLLQGLAKVFVVERTLDKADGGFPIRLDYKATCPKYRALCPLPADAARDLLAIALEGGPPEACRRYATLSKLR